MRRSLLTLLVAIAASITTSARTLVVYYSYTNHVQTIVTDLATQIEADIVRIEPAEKGVDYAANNYAIGSALISAIRNHPNDAASYPAIDPVDVDMSRYDMVIVAAPLWWSNMAAPMQTFLFEHGREMAGKRIGLIVSSASSGISQVVADAKRLIPSGRFIEPSLWIRSAETSRCHSLTSQWLRDIDYTGITSAVDATYGEDMAEVTLTTDGIMVRGMADRVSIYDAGGRRVAETLGRTAAHPLAPGCYIVQVSRGSRVSVQKQVVR